MQLPVSRPAHQGETGLRERVRLRPPGADRGRCKTGCRGREISRVTDLNVRPLLWCLCALQRAYRRREALLGLSHIGLGLRHARLVFRETKTEDDRDSSAAQRSRYGSPSRSLAAPSSARAIGVRTVHDDHRPNRPRRDEGYGQSGRKARTRQRRPVS
jgi:hypothetical protein